MDRLHDFIEHDRRVTHPGERMSPAIRPRPGAGGQHHAVPIKTREEVLPKRQRHPDEDFQLAKNDDLDLAVSGDFRLAIDSGRGP